MGTSFKVRSSAAARGAARGRARQLHWMAAASHEFVVTVRLNDRMTARFDDSYPSLGKKPRPSRCLSDFVWIHDLGWTEGGTRRRRDFGCEMLFLLGYKGCSLIYQA